MIRIPLRRAEEWGMSPASGVMERETGIEPATLSLGKRKGTKK